MRLHPEASERLDRFLAGRFPEHSRTKLAQWIRDGGVLVNGKPGKAGLTLRAGDVVEVNAEPPTTSPHDLAPADIPLEIVYEDDGLLVVNKPRGLAAHPAASLREPSLVNALLGRGGPLSEGEGFRPGIVHRLDKETTGLMAIAKTDAAHAHLARQFERKTAERRYLGIVAGHPERDRFDIAAPIGRDPRNRQRMAVVADGKPALTHCRVVRQLPGTTLTAFRLSTGRTHQIRVHLRAIGHPIVGDDLYATAEWRAGPLQLHAAFLALDQPSGGGRIELWADPPPDFLAPPGSANPDSVRFE